MHSIRSWPWRPSRRPRWSAGGPALAQQKLKWAHVYETSEPYHTESVWAAAEIKKRTNGKFDIEVFPASHARQGNRHQPGHGARHGRHDHQRPVVRRAQLPAPRHRVLPVHLPRRRPPASPTPRARCSPRWSSEFRKKTGIQILAYTYYGARHTTAKTAFTNCAGMKGLKIRVPDVPIVHGDAEGLRRQSDADSLRRGLPRAADRDGRRAGEPADDDRGQEVLRGAEGHHADRPHRRRPDHAGRAARVEQADRPGEADLHRGHARSRGAGDGADQEARGRARRRVQEEGPAGRRGRPARASSTRC